MRSHLRPGDARPGIDSPVMSPVLPPSVSRAQLPLPFTLEGDGDPGRDAAGFPTAPVLGAAGRSQSRREFRPAEAAKQVRMARTPQDDTHAVAAALALFLPPGKRLELRLTDNHYSMISVRRQPDGYRLHLHRMFVAGGPRIVRALARYVVHNDRRASALLGTYIEENQHVIRKQERAPRQVRLRTAGQHHDLQAIFDRLNAERFGGQLQARITWGPVAERKGNRRSIKMGSFAVEDRLIRVHPALDAAHVPDYFVAWIVFHEMLHGKHEIPRKDGRRRFHTREFLDEERTFADYHRACAWEKANLDRLLRG